LKWLKGDAVGSFVRSKLKFVIMKFFSTAFAYRRDCRRNTATYGGAFRIPGPRRDPD